MVLAKEGPHGPVIHAGNRAATLIGIRAGERVVDMRTLCPELRVEYADLIGDDALADRLANWVRRWGPWSARDGVHGIILDATGVAHLFGGEAALLEDIEAGFSALGLRARVAMAPTWGAAWALARFGAVRAICAEGEVAQALRLLPVSSLRLTAGSVQLLDRLGLKIVGDLAAIPRQSLARRFNRTELAANPLLRLDQAMGRLAEPVSGEDVADPIRATARLPEPIQDPTAHLPRLCADLCAQLAEGGMGCRRLRLTVYHTDGEVRFVVVATSRPSRDPLHLARLFDGKLERLDPGFGFDLIVLHAEAVDALDDVQQGLDGTREDGISLAHLIDRLSARFGAEAITRPLPCESHIPERAEQQIPALHEAPQGHITLRERPVRLLRTPEEVRVIYAVPEGPPAQFVWRRQTLRVARYAGPERIAPEWWHDKPAARLRDYFKIEDHTGRRLWLYREGLHEDGRGGEPRWFVHGMFA